jgi:hypothetical protein
MLSASPDLVRAQELSADALMEKNWLSFVSGGMQLSILTSG